MHNIYFISFGEMFFSKRCSYFYLAFCVNSSLQSKYLTFFRIWYINVYKDDNFKKIYLPKPILLHNIM